jgi:hypothetical protein
MSSSVPRIAFAPKFGAPWLTAVCAARTAAEDRLLADSRLGLPAPSGSRTTRQLERRRRSCYLLRWAGIDRGREIIHLLVGLGRRSAYRNAVAAGRLLTAYLRSVQVRQSGLDRKALPLGLEIPSKEPYTTPHAPSKRRAPFRVDRLPKRKDDTEPDRARGHRPAPIEKRGVVRCDDASPHAVS